VAMRAMLRKFSMEDKRDYTMIESPFPTMRAMLSEKKVDLIPAVIPFSYDPELRKIGRTLFIQRDAIGVTDMIVWTARKPFLDKNRAAVVDFMEDTLRITRWFLDPNNHKEAIEIAGRVTKQPPAPTPRRPSLPPPRRHRRARPRPRAGSRVPPARAAASRGARHLRRSDGACAPPSRQSLQDARARPQRNRDLHRYRRGLRR